MDLIVVLRSLQGRSHGNQIWDKIDEIGRPNVFCVCLDAAASYIQGAPIKNNPLRKIHYPVTVTVFFSPNLQLSQRRIRATYAANFVTIFAMV